MRRSKKMYIYPWDISGYVKLSWGGKQKLLWHLISEYRTIKNINNNLGLPNYWFNNFKRNDKINTKELKKIVNITNLNLVDDIIQFNDDNGSSSISYIGTFPIKYNPFWHFLFCLSVGDGHIQKGKKKKFTWYQKPEGQRKLIELFKKHNFNYLSSPKSAKQGIVIPQLIRKVGSFVTGLDSSESIRKSIVEKSRMLGKGFELALLFAFFLDESGMCKSKANSEITLHQEGNLQLLEKIGELLNRFNVKWSRNKKGDKWCIRVNPDGVVQLSKLFISLEKYDVTLLHREDIFYKKVNMAKKTMYKLPLRRESISIRKYLLDNYKDRIITINEIRTYFASEFNVSSRCKKLVSTMKLKKELEIVSLGKYVIKEGQK